MVRLNKTLLILAKSNPIVLMAFGFGSGLMPVAPGTCGTLVAMPFYMLLSFLPWKGYLFFLVFAFFLGIFICNYTTNLLKTHDHPSIVWDEFVGYWVTMFLAPEGWQWAVLGFVLFRLFDIVKVPPISHIDKSMMNGWGIMLDDVLAGVMAWICLQGVATWL